MRFSTSLFISAFLCGLTISFIVVAGCTNLGIAGLPGFQASQTMSPSNSGSETTGSANTGSPQDKEGDAMCPAGYESWTACPDNLCYDLTSDPTHCGSCSNSVCSAAQICTNGQCQSGASKVQEGSNTCSVSFATNNPKVNAEIYLDNSDSGYATPYTLSIQPGDHSYSLKKAGYQDYVGTFTIKAPAAEVICYKAINVSMINAQSGNPCNSDSDCKVTSEQQLTLQLKHGKMICKNGKCLPDCISGWTKCEEPLTCVNLSSDAQNCGGCGKSCEGTCTGGVCKLTFSPIAVVTKPMVRAVPIIQKIQP